MVKASKLKDITRAEEGVILDFVMDRLSVVDVQTVLNASSERISLLKDYMVRRTPFFYIDTTTGVPAYYYHMHDDTFHRVDQAQGGRYQLVQLGVVERSKVKDIVNEMRNNVKVLMSTGDIKSVKGFMERAKDGMLNFKLIDSNSTKGYVCHKTSTLLVSELKQRIADASPSVRLEDPVVKLTLCEIYEILLRAQGPSVFRRPFARKN